MTETQVTPSQKYILQKNGALNLSYLALHELGWKRGETSIDQYIDLKRNRLIIVESGASVGGLPKKEIENVQPLFRSYQIGQLGLMSIDKETRQRLGWELGEEFWQTLDKRLKGIIITRVKEKDDDRETHN